VPIETNPASGSWYAHFSASGGWHGLCISPQLHGRAAHSFSTLRGCNETCSARSFAGEFRARLKRDCHRLNRKVSHREHSHARLGKWLGNPGGNSAKRFDLSLCTELEH
jgi:hypothetical protein